MSTWKRITKIGSGGFGEVWRVKRVEDGRECAQKRLILDSTISAIDVERFKREVRLLKSLDHQHIIKVVGVHVQEEPLWYVAPLYKGNLRDILNKLCDDKEISFKVIDQMLSAIEYAHKNGVIHRDLKPENILWDEHHNIVISDFGLGRRLDAETTRKTHTGQRMGTPYYMAPEQELNAKDTTHLSDIYSLGRIIYEIYSGDPPSAQQDLSQLDSGLRHLIAKCTRRNPAERYHGVDELRRDFALAVGKVASYESGDGLRELLTRLQAGEWGYLERFHSALYARKDDPDAIHGAVMNLPPEVARVYHEQFPDGFREIIHSFCSHIISTPWSFDYCDRIATALRGLYDATSDEAVRVACLRALLIFGVGHNRFYVMNTFRDLLAKMSDPGEIMAAREMLAENPRELSFLKRELLKRRLPATIREIVEKLPE